MNSEWDDALSLENPQDLFAVLDKYPKVQAVLFGHAHESVEFDKNGLKIIAYHAIVGDIFERGNEVQNLLIV
jgi:Icc protein